MNSKHNTPKSPTKKLLQKQPERGWLWKKRPHLTRFIYGAVILLGAFWGFRSVQALEQIARPYSSIKSLGRGGTRFALGTYDDNFYGNPALVADNPGFRFTILDPTVEVNYSLISNASKIATLATDLANLGTNIAALTGKNSHVRYQQSAFSFYFQVPSIGMGFSFGLPLQLELNLIPRANNSFDLGMLFDIGPQISVAKKFSLASQNDLGVGLTGKVAYRLSTGSPLSIQRLVTNGMPKISDLAGEGSHFDFDLGVSYRLPWTPWDLEFITGMALGNILGGGYTNMSIRPLGLTSSPAAYGRNFGIGTSVIKRQMWLFTDTSIAVEMSEIGPNGAGNPFRSFHFGMETNFFVLNARFGIHQGYLTFGAGLNLWFLTLDYANYGEEMSLNPGDFEDRRHAFKLALQIQLSKPKPEMPKVHTPEPAVSPTPQPSETPVPGAEPAAQPSVTPEPGAAPTPQPSVTPEPGAAPTPQPTTTPEPGAAPTPQPSGTPEPGASPTPQPSALPTGTPEAGDAAKPDSGQPTTGSAQTRGPKSPKSKATKAVAPKKGKKKKAPAGSP